MRRVLLVAAMLLFVRGIATAQQCEIGVYADPEGTQNYADPPEAQVFSVYVIIFAEDVVAAAAYSMVVPTGVFLQARWTGPSGRGLVIDEPTGTNAALAECVVGFGGNPVIVDEYQFVLFWGIFTGYGLFSLGPNASQDPALPQYVNCNDTTNDCQIGPNFCLHCYFPTEESSFGTIKSLFNN